MTKLGNSRQTAAASAQPEAKPNVRGKVARQKILAAAARHFGELGYRGASAGAIAQEAGISEPGLLHHFGSKQRLLMALLDLRYSQDSQKLLAEQELEALALLPLLAKLVRENLRHRESIRLSMVIFAESISATHPSHDFFKRRYTRARDIVGGHLDRAKARGNLKKSVDTRALAAVLLAAMDGLQMQWLLDRRIDMAHCFAVLAQLLQTAIASPKKRERG
jgi:AcrR family transcriptional regulator